jgi:pyridinium-3,5-biscarboxylic acid mononucleotide sulfurtransferase
VARIEVRADELPRLVEEPLRGELIAHFKSLGFKFIALDLEGFRSGSLNALLPVESLQIAAKTPFSSERAPTAGWSATARHDR